MKEPKIQLSPRDKITEDSDTIKMLNEITLIRGKLNKAIYRHNYLINLREEIAIVAHEYMSSQMKEITCDENRHLLAKGCTAEIDELVLEISNIKATLNSLIYK